MERKVQSQLQQLRFAVAGLIVFNIFILLSAFNEKKKNRFEEIDAERINIIEKDGTLKLALFNSERLTRGIAKRQGEGTIAGLLFYNQEGHEAGGLVFDGKKINGGQTASESLTFDGYRQDQAVALQYNEYKDSSKFEVDAGLSILYRPDRSITKEEYDFYDYISKFKGSQYQKDSITNKMANEGRISTRRLFVGTKHGIRDGQPYDESGLYVRNKMGKVVLKIYVDKNNQPKIEFLDSLGKKVLREL